MKESLFLLLFLLISKIQLRQIQLPIFYDQHEISAKLNTYKIIKQPDIDFQNIYYKSVTQINNGNPFKFPPCEQNLAEVQFFMKDQITFTGIPKKPNVIYNFQDIQFSQFLLDVYYQHFTIYIVFKNHRLLIVNLINDQQIYNISLYDITGVNSSNYMEIGYFIKIGQDILFVNNLYTIKINKTGGSVLSGYQKYSDFQSVTALENNYFAVINSTTGIYIYSYDGKKVQKVTSIQTDVLSQLNTTSLQLMDLVYYLDQKILITVDYGTGAKAYQVTYTSNNITLQLVQLDTPITKSSKCKLSYLYSTTLYIYCTKMYTYNLKNWPQIQQTFLPLPNNEVRQIYQINDLIAFVGRNVFTILYHNQVVNYFQDNNLDKLVFADKLYISANQGALQIGQINIIQPYISCLTSDKSFIGTTKLQFKTKAECNENYFLQYQIDISKYGLIYPTDICTYTINKSIRYWQVGTINHKVFIVPPIAIAVIIMIIIVVFLITKIRIRRVIQRIEQYSTSFQGQSAKNHLQLVEQLDDKKSGSSNTLKKQSSNDEKINNNQNNKLPDKSNQIVQQEVVHDIGH